MDKLKYELVSNTRYQEQLLKKQENPNVLIALTNHCNFKCKYCATAHENKVKQHMPIVIAKKIITECCERGWSFSFGQTYEPFLHPDIAELIKFVDANGRHFISATNGIAINKKSYDLPMDLIISFSATEADFMWRQSKMSYSQYQKKIIEFMRYRIDNRVAGNIKFQIADYSILKSDDCIYDKQINDFDAIYEKILTVVQLFGVEVESDQEKWISQIKARIPIMIHKDGDMQFQVVATKIMPSISEAFCSEDIPVTEYGYCDSCYVMMSIQADGGMALCCCDPTAKVIGDWFTGEQSLFDLWNGRNMIKIRQAFQQFMPLHKFCGKCLQNVSEHIKPLLTVYAPELVCDILRQKGITDDLPWVKVR